MPRPAAVADWRTPPITLTPGMCWEPGEWPVTKRTTISLFQSAGKQRTLVFEFAGVFAHDSFNPPNPRQRRPGDSSNCSCGGAMYPWLTTRGRQTPWLKQVRERYHFFELANARPPRNNTRDTAASMAIPHRSNGFHDTRIPVDSDHPTSRVPRRAAQPRLSRRQLLLSGTLSAANLGLTGLAPGHPAHQPNPAASAPIQACILIYYFGGPSHVDLWDMKPQAPTINQPPRKRQTTQKMRLFRSPTRQKHLTQLPPVFQCVPPCCTVLAAHGGAPPI